MINGQVFGREEGILVHYKGQKIHPVDGIIKTVDGSNPDWSIIGLNGLSCILSDKRVLKNSVPEHLFCYEIACDHRSITPEDPIFIAKSVVNDRDFWGTLLSPVKLKMNPVCPVNWSMINFVEVDLISDACN